MMTDPHCAAQGAHNRNMTVVFITLNTSIFCQGKVASDNALNIQYSVLFNKIKHLGQQLYPSGKWKGFMEAYEDSTSKP